MQVQLDALANNARQIRSLLKNDVKMLCVIKADAYGHGASKVAECLSNKGLADAFAVATSDEGVSLRKSGMDKLPVVVLGYSCEEAALESVKYGLSQTVFDVDGLLMLENAAKAQKKNARAHLKIDTGMSRIGVKGDQALAALLSKWQECPHVEMEGVFTHFSSADADPAFTQNQLIVFENAVSVIRKFGFSPIRHAAASAALWNENYMLDMVRAGIALYGVENGPLNGKLRFAQRLITHPSRITELDEGESVGYSRKFVCQRRTRLMTLPCGYGDGYPRILSGRADVLVNGKRAPIVGNICMDMLMADITDVGEVTRDTVVTLLGADGAETITPEELALKAETIPYEIMLGFAPRVERRYLDQ